MKTKIAFIALICGLAAASVAQTNSPAIQPDNQGKPPVNVNVQTNSNNSSENNVNTVAADTNTLSNINTNSPSNSSGINTKRWPEPVTNDISGSTTNSYSSTSTNSTPHHWWQFWKH
jgi:hypothetical protein